MRVIYHPLMLEHVVDEDCMEQPRRIEDVVVRLSEDHRENVELAPNGEEYLQLFHLQSYIEQVRDISERISSGNTETREPNSETYFSKGSFDAACYAVGAAVRGAEIARQGGNAFALVRPPGHHAFRHTESGFCIFNNIVIATEYLRRQGERVLIVDLDLHFGDGTWSYAREHCVVDYYSISHASMWPHIESRDRSMIELPEGTKDDDYITTLRRSLPIYIDTFDPTIIAVSLGFDTHREDHSEFGAQFGGGFDLTEKSYKAIRRVLEESFVPYFCVLEGGYHPSSVEAGFSAFFE